MANRRPLEGSKSWLSSVVGNITGMWESMKSSSAPNRDRLDSRNSTNGHHDAGSEGDVQGRRSPSAHERGSSSFLGRMRRRSTVEATVNTGGQSEHLDEDDLHEGRSSSFQEKSSFSFLGRIGRRSSSERLGSTDCQRKSFGGDSVSETRSSLQSGGSSSFLSQIRRLSGAERTAGADYRRESPSEEDFEEGRSSSLLSSYRRRNQGEHSENTDSQHSPVSKDGTYERLLSQKSPSTFLSRIRRHSKGDDTVITATPFLYATAQGSDGVVKSSRSGRIAHTARASAMRIGKDSSVCGAPDSSGSMGDVSASPSSQEEITIVAHNPRKRVHEREQLERSENIFLLETSGANVTFPKKFRKIAAEQSDLHQAGSAVAHPQFNFPKDQKFPTIFSSSAAQLVSSDSEHNDHGCSSPRTLSSRTKSILDGLDKVGSPLVNAHKWRFTDEPEQWASDLLNSSVQKPPANTGRTISRGNVVSDAISHSVRHNHKRRRISRQQTRAIRSSGVTASSVHVTPQRSSSKQPSPMSSKKLTPVKVTAPPRVESASLIKPLKQILRHTDRNSTSAANNNFSAKWAELGVVRHEDISTQTTSIEFQPVTANVETAHYARPLSLPERMFDFTNAQRRAPSESFIVEDAHTAEVESRQLSGHNRHRSEAESELALDSSKKAAAAKNSSLQKGASQGSQEGYFSEEKRATKPHDGVSVENGGHMPIADANVTAASQADLTFPKDAAAPVQWSCKTCFVSNKPEADKCVACGESKGTVSGADKATGDTGDKQWYCKTCFVSNGPHSRECSLCGQARSDSSAKNESFCKQCFVKVLPGKDNCVSCGAHLTISTNAPVANVFGSRAFKPASASGSGGRYVFGLTSSSASSTSQVIPTDAMAAPVSHGAGTSVSANVSAEANGLQEAARFDADHGNLTPRLGLATSSSTSDVGTASEQADHAAPQNVEAERKAKEVQANIAQSTAREESQLVGASGTMGQGTPASVFPTLAAPAANRPLAPSVPLFGSLSASVSTTTPPAASAFNFGSTSETRPPTLFGFTTSGALHATTAPVTSATTAVLSFSTAGAPSQEDESDSRGALASNSVEMMSPVEPPSESAAAPVQPFTFGAAANAAQPSGLFNFGTAVPVGPTGTSTTGGLFGDMNTNGALSIAPAAPFQFHPPPAAARAFSTPSVVPPAPSVFNFGGSSTINGSAEGFSFGSTTTPAVFNFGAQPGPTPSFVFGSNPSGAPPAFGAAPTTNFFASGSSSSTTTTRKMLKARRIRR